MKTVQKINYSAHRDSRSSETMMRQIVVKCLYVYYLAEQASPFQLSLAQKCGRGEKLRR